MHINKIVIARLSRMIGIRADRYVSLGLAMALVLNASAHADTLSEASSRTLAVGILAHDRGPTSDQHENGVDLNLEMQFEPLNILGSPRPHLGLSLNFVGDTNVAYAGLGFRLHDSAIWFLDGLIGVAVHDGPLHKDPVPCKLYSDCGYGTRLLPRFGLELGYRLDRATTVSLFYDHMSHKWIVAGENEGLDHIGLRYLWAY